jgi:COP9 signalosome complex subunit 3
MLRLDPSLSCFTSTHTLFAYFCLRTKAFQVALPVLDKDIYHFPCSPDKYAYLPLPCAHHDTSSTYITTTSGLTSKPSYRDHLTYFLYGAMLYLGVKDWERALLFLEVVIMSPTSNNASMIQVEAYKKWLLVGLLLKGRVSS